MKRRLAILLTLAMLLGMVGFAEDFEINEEIVIEAEEAEIPPDEVELELGDIDLFIDGVELSAENEIDGAVELAEDVDRSNASEDFDIQDGVLVKYKGPGGDAVIPDNVIRIRSEAFADCSSLTSVFIPENVTTIGSWAFFNCANLESVILENGVVDIFDSAFGFCPSLKQINLPDSVEHLGGLVFEECTNLSEVFLSRNLTTISRWCFSRIVRQYQLDPPAPRYDPVHSLKQFFLRRRRLS